jgi:pSer/pThr/pTyr-binding forkhead associated (FHA) protein
MTQGHMTMAENDLELESTWRLAGTDGAGREQLIIINRDELTRAYPGITVGRHPKLCDRTVDEPSLSRRHFRLSRSAEGVTIEDLSSLNGTLLDGVALAPYVPVKLADGQTIRAGKLTLKVSRVA